MAALWIVAGILLLAAALLSVSLTVYVRITDKVDIKIGILGWKRKINLEQEEEKPQKGRAKKSRRRKNNASELQKPEKKANEKSFRETVQFGIQLLKTLLPPAGDASSHIRITSLWLHMTVTCGEADKTAIAYGGVSAGVYTLLGLLDSKLTLRIKSVHIAPDFMSDRAVYDISFKAKLRLCHILKAAIGILFKLAVNTKNSRGEASGGLQPNKSKTLNKAVQ